MLIDEEKRKDFEEEEDEEEGEGIKIEEEENYSIDEIFDEDCEFKMEDKKLEYQKILKKIEERSEFCEENCFDCIVEHGNELVKNVVENIKSLNFEDKYELFGKPETTSHLIYFIKFFFDWLFYEKFVNIKLLFN